jgi:uncharacterized cupin superfamily protein
VSRSPGSVSAGAISDILPRFHRHQYILSGTGELLLDAGAGPVRAGDVFVLKQGLPTICAAPARSS